jgi:hypothetical protein
MRSSGVVRLRVILANVSASAASIEIVSRREPRGLPLRPASRVHPRAVGGHGDVHAGLRNRRDDGREIGVHGRLTARDTDPRNPECRGEAGERAISSTVSSSSRGMKRTSGVHAVHAAEVAPVRDADAEMTDGSAV